MKETLESYSVGELQELIEYAQEVLFGKQNNKEQVDFWYFWSELVELVGNSGHETMDAAIEEWFTSNPKRTVELNEEHQYILAREAVAWEDEYRRKKSAGSWYAEPFYATQEERDLVAKWTSSHNIS